MKNKQSSRLRDLTGYSHPAISLVNIFEDYFFCINKLLVKWYEKKLQMEEYNFLVEHIKVFFPSSCLDALKFRFSFSLNSTSVGI